MLVAGGTGLPCSMGEERDGMVSVSGSLYHSTSIRPGEGGWVTVACHPACAGGRDQMPW